ncbi:hypothetical protein CDL12_11005 [Handroanthus impetiginosus]|uniref:Uncharacterized protein n=1 Tax=Handroanthus impetiginosus TaxID=429701 RepID=A0A2G9HFN4_9LAMI|nr:hypothetical protein CDL12_11005 [Handroanthus impetiginosus]
MGSKQIAIFGILLAIVLLISSKVAARELTETSNTINTSKEDKKINGDNGHAPITPPSLNPKRPFCNRKSYASCVPSHPIPKTRKCDYKNPCRKTPPS